MSEPPTFSGPDSNAQIFNRVADSYVDLALDPAERRLLARLAPELGSMEMLDIGVGTGRTGYTFAPLVKRYVGIDYAPAMLDRARALLDDDSNVEIIQGDARELSEVDGSFDLVIFSFNGIDAMGYSDRLRVLHSVKKVLRPGGWFLFSSHSTGALPLPTTKARSPRRMNHRLYRWFARLDDIPYGIRVRRVNRRTSLEKARRQGWVTVRGIGHRFTLDDCYIDPVHQVDLLTERGFEVVEVLDVGGRPVTFPHVESDLWLHYVCRNPNGKTVE